MSVLMMKLEGTKALHEDGGNTVAEVVRGEGVIQQTRTVEA